MALTAPAKVNLALHVTGRRADGYHLLDSVAVFADAGDRVTVAASERLEVSLSGPFAPHAPGDRSDLAWRAAEAFFAHIGREPRVRIDVVKNLPAGAGLGGGSSDAATVLRALNDLAGAGVPAVELQALGLALGADVPMCLAGRALRARGIGEVLEPLPDWPVLPLVLVWPGCAVSTATIFSALASRENPPLPQVPRLASAQEAAAWLRRLRNDLETAASDVAPEIGDVLAALGNTRNCLLARMSGSGSACFGLYPSAKEAEAAAAQLASSRRGWWVRAANAG